MLNLMEIRRFILMIQVTDLDKPDNEGCVLMAHIEGDYYLIKLELQ